jgi:hypothetical protein
VTYAIAHVGGLSADYKQANATAFRQWRSWLRGPGTYRNTQFLSIPFRSGLIHWAA